MQALDDDGRERSSHHYVPPSPGPAYLGPASVRWRTDMNQKTAFAGLVRLARADPSSLSRAATTPLLLPVANQLPEAAMPAARRMQNPLVCHLSDTARRTAAERGTVGKRSTAA